MPIATKTSTTNSKPEASNPGRTISSRARKPEDKTSGTQTKSSRSAVRATSSSTNPSAGDLQDRRIPHPAVKTAPTAGTQQPRIASTTTSTTASTRAAVDRPISSSRSTSTSSTATRRTVDPPPTGSSTAIPHRTTVNKSRIATSNAVTRVPSSRIGSVTTKSIAPSITATRPKATSNLPSPTKPTSTSTRARRDTSSTSRPTSTTSKYAPSTQPQPPPPSSLPSSSSTQANSLTHELLQLLHVHVASTSTLNGYKTSIRTRLQHTQTQVQTQQTALLALETARREALSVQALDAWVRTFPSPDAAARQIRVLGVAIRDLDVFRDDDGVELKPLREFESWIGDVLAIREERGIGHGSGVDSSSEGPATTTSTNGNSSNGTNTRKMKSIQPLGPAWTQSMQRLRETLIAIRDMLLGLGDVGDIGKGGYRETGIEGLVARQRAFVEVLLGEVEVAVGIERAVMRAEREWEGKEVERILKELDLGGIENVNDERGEGGPGPGPGPGMGVRGGRIGSEAGIWA